MGYITIVQWVVEWCIIFIGRTFNSVFKWIDHRIVDVMVLEIAYIK